MPATQGAHGLPRPCGRTRRLTDRPPTADVRRPLISQHHDPARQPHDARVGEPTRHGHRLRCVDAPPSAIPTLQTPTTLLRSFCVSIPCVSSRASIASAHTGIDCRSRECCGHQRGVHGAIRATLALHQAQRVGRHMADREAGMVAKEAFDASDGRRRCLSTETTERQMRW